jgi:hypothetical protein
MHTPSLKIEEDIEFPLKIEEDIEFPKVLTVKLFSGKTWKLISSGD